MVDSDTDRSPAAAARRRLSASAPAPQSSPLPGAPRRETSGSHIPLNPRDAPAIPPTPQRPAPGAAPEAPEGGFSLSNWFDGIPEPDWEAIGDRVMATPAVLATTYRETRAQAKVRAIRNAAEHEAKRLNLIEAQATAKAAQVIADQQEAQAKARAEAQRVAKAKRDAEHLAVAAKQADIEAHRLAERERLVAFQAVAVSDAFLRNQRILDAQLAAEARQARLPPPPTSAERLEAEVSAARAAIEASRTPLYVAPYDLPSTAPNPPANGADMLRRVLVSLVAVLVPAGFWWWAGIEALGFGFPEGHLFSPGRSLLAPAAEAQWIWPVIFSGFIAFAIYQWFPSQRSALRQRAVGYPAAAALLLGFGWLWCTHAGLELPALALCMGTTTAICYALRQLNLLTARSTWERVFTDAPVALFLGWMLALTPASIAGLFGGRGPVQQFFAVLALMAVVCLAAAWAMTERGRVVLALGFGWCMFWVVTERLLGPFPSVWVALAACLGAFVVLVAAENRRYQINHAEHRAARGQSTIF
ncbi:hypothetical protein [Paeniglutamicibacter cryotolerans]|uniref:Uncharacterized protein n=1 Tax=Paeniglutamicibacter cryotolerans TaxID=670079 RepID=A0A839QKJ5_9MICC|nr:hypothetical protein [Paeniglutamicibacter cryotolerans]MBB2995284.1 hypothetical protein [Paeniglutamicibacter cryotolerans]